MTDFGDERLPPRFWNKVRVDPSGCWMWTAAMRHGYGAFLWGTTVHNAHRPAYMELVGPIPEGFEVDHLCHGADESCTGGKSCPHRACVNPAHLEAVPQRTNTLRGRSPAARNAKKTHCIHGHEFTPENTGYEGRNRKRYCRTCVYAKNEAIRARQGKEFLRARDKRYRDAFTPDQKRRMREAVDRYRAKKKALT